MSRYAFIFTAALLVGMGVRCAAQVSPEKTKLTLKQAEALALANNPQITASRLNAMAAHQVTREVQSGLLPSAFTSLTAVNSQENSRISAGGLNNPIIYERAAVGTTFSQLITDFGRTTNLLASSRFRAEAEDNNAMATRQQVLLAVDQAFYNALQSRALLQVAQQTVASRQLLLDRVQALAKSKLKSTLDVSFASVSVAQAKLLLLDAQNNYHAALAALSATLGFPTQQDFELIDEAEELTPPPGNVDGLIVEAFRNRPDLAALQSESDAAKRFRTAERDLSFPSISALGSVGSSPIRNDHLGPWYGAVGVNLTIPVFNGMLYKSRAAEAALRSQAAEQRVQDLRNRVARDVRTSWLNANTAFSRLDVTRQLLAQANLALDLAQTRYNLGLGSIVEFSQAELQKTEADIADTAARYQYRAAQAALQYQLGTH